MTITLTIECPDLNERVYNELLDEIEGIITSFFGPDDFTMKDEAA